MSERRGHKVYHRRGVSAQSGDRRGDLSFGRLGRVAGALTQGSTAWTDADRSLFGADLPRQGLVSAGLRQIETLALPLLNQPRSLLRAVGAGAESGNA